MLRSEIWKMLRELSAFKKTTVVITTHYIEEASQAGKVAFIRKGKVLTEGSPLQMTQSFGAKNLENSFIHQNLIDLA